MLLTKVEALALFMEHLPHLAIDDIEIEKTGEGAEYTRAIGKVRGVTAASIIRRPHQTAVFSWLPIARVRRVHTETHNERT